MRGGEEDREGEEVEEEEEEEEEEEGEGVNLEFASRRLNGCPTIYGCWPVHTQRTELARCVITFASRVRCGGPSLW